MHWFQLRLINYWTLAYVWKYFNPHTGVESCSSTWSPREQLSRVELACRTKDTKSPSPGAREKQQWQYWSPVQNLFPLLFLQCNNTMHFKQSKWLKFCLTYSKLEKKIHVPMRIQSIYPKVFHPHSSHSFLMIILCFHLISSSCIIIYTRGKNEQS